MFGQMTLSEKHHKMQIKEMQAKCFQINLPPPTGEKFCPGKILPVKNPVPILILPGKNSVPSSWEWKNI
jgi:hypothetical protein